MPSSLLLGTAACGSGPASELTSPCLHVAAPGSTIPEPLLPSPCAGVRLSAGREPASEPANSDF